MSTDPRNLLAKSEAATTDNLQVSERPWKILVLDDDDSVIQFTDKLLQGFQFLGRNLEIQSFTTITAGQQYMKKNPDVALILLDVVMEEIDSGLKFAKYLREQLKNHKTRILLRTGQPWKAPEKEVMEQYDINDYKVKTELDSESFKSSIRSALKNYQEIAALTHHQESLEKINMLKQLLLVPNNSMPDGYELRSHSNKILSLLMDMLYHPNEITDQMAGLVIYVIKDKDRNKVIIPTQAVIESFTRGRRFSCYILSRYGHYKKNTHVINLSETAQSLLQESCNNRRSLFTEHYTVLYDNHLTESLSAGKLLIYLEEVEPLNKQQKQLAQLFLHQLYLTYASYWRIFSLSY